ncbi:MAG: rRNA pseudouridine synthase [Eubacterium sp.]|nr:rRNA pseudouridine synthase [Eubacterium sp.]
MERLDKLLSSRLNITRKQAKELIKNEKVSVNGKTVKSADFKCGDDDEVVADSKRINTSRFVYIMMNKPKGVICASDGKGDKTVIDLLPEDMKRKGLFPAGRLDKDTTGFVLITDDGEFAHNILSPKKHIEKAYTALLDKPVNENVIKDFEAGMSLGEEKLLPARLKTLNENNTEVEIIISQGIYHQIKRMFLKHGITVLELKRTSLGSLTLDKNLKEGESRYLTEEESAKIHS